MNMKSRKEQNIGWKIDVCMCVYDGCLYACKKERQQSILLYLYVHKYTWKYARARSKTYTQSTHQKYTYTHARTYAHWLGTFELKCSEYRGMEKKVGWLVLTTGGLKWGGTVYALSVCMSVYVRVRLYERMYSQNNRALVYLVSGVSFTLLLSDLSFNPFEL